MHPPMILIISGIGRKKTDNERTNKKGNDSIKEGKEGNGKANVPPITQNPIGKTTSLIRKWKLFSGHVRIRNLILSPPFLVCCASLVFLWVHFSLQRPRTTRPFLLSFLPHVCCPEKERGISLLSSIRRRKKKAFFQGSKKWPLFATTRRFVSFSRCNIFGTAQKQMSDFWLLLFAATLFSMMLLVFDSCWAEIERETFGKASAENLGLSHNKRLRV